MANTSQWGIYYPLGTDLMKIASQDLPRMASSVEGGINALRNNLRGEMDAKTRTAVATTGGRALSSMRAAAWLNKGVANGAARVVFLGDSKMEGVGASSLATRSQSVASRVMRDRLFGGAGDQGDGYIPCQAQFGNSWGATSISGTSGTDYVFENKAGLGARNVVLKTVGTTVTYTARSFRYLQVHYPVGPDWPGSFEVVVDGVVRSTVSNSAGSASEKIAELDLGSIASRTVVLRGKTANACVEGVTFQTAKTGLTQYDAGRSGARADEFDNGPGWSMNVQAIGAVDPHLIVIGLGGNDMAGAWGQPISALAFVTSLRQLYDKLTSACPNAGIVFLMAAMRLEDARAATSTDYRNKLLEYEEGVRTVLGGLERMSLLFESSLWQPLNGSTRAAQDPAGWLADGIDPADLGHRAIGAYVANSMLETLPLDVVDGGTL